MCAVLHYSGLTLNDLPTDYMNSSWFSLDSEILTRGSSQITTSSTNTQSFLAASHPAFVVAANVEATSALVPKDANVQALASKCHKLLDDIKSLTNDITEEQPLISLASVLTNQLNFLVQCKQKKQRMVRKENEKKSAVRKRKVQFQQ